MSQGTETETRSRGMLVGRMAADLAAEATVAAGGLFVIDALAHRKLTAGGFGLLLAGWVVALAAARLVRTARAAGRDWAGAAIEFAGPWLWLAACNPFLKQPWTLPQMLYAAGLVGSLWQLWRRVTGGRPGEQARVLLVAAVAAWGAAPFITDLQVGGTDARWYSGVFTDFIQQLRAGVFPVFIGQGDLSYNGSANLFRSAPLCLWLGGLGDWLTWQSLSPIAIRNLAVLAAALGAGLGMYAALVRLLRTAAADAADAGWARWLAALGATVYLLCPAVLLSLHFYELQMTYTALAALPWVVYGNIRTMQDTRGEGYGVLAVGLTLAWLAHVPLAVIATLGTLALQSGRFIFEPGALAAQWKAAVGGAVLFALLSAYYFLGMSELAAVAGPTLPREAGFLLSVVLMVFAAGQVMQFRRWPWLAGWLAGGALIGWLAPAWLPWAVIWSGLWLTAGLVSRAMKAGPADGRTVLLAVATMLVAAALAKLYTAGRAYAPEDMHLRDLAAEAAALREFVRPLDAQLGKYGNSQPGYTLWALMLAAVVAAGRWRSVTLALLAGVMGLLVVLVLPVPLVSEFIVGFAPPQFGKIVNLPMFYRLVPPLAAFGVVAGFLALVQWGAGRRTGQVAVVAALAAGAAWSAWEARRVIDLGFTKIGTRAATEQAFTRDSFALGRYPYLMLYTPLHFIDGKNLPLLDTRLLTPRYDLIVGPDQLAAEAEKSAEQVFPLTSTLSDANPEWLWLTPGWEVQPGVTLLLRFEFFEKFNPRGWLIMSSNRGYQEHYLDPAFMGAGFGAGPRAAHTIAVTNSGAHNERYTLRMKMDSGNTLPRDGGVWGRVHLSRYDPEKASVRVDSLLPYRARVTMPEDGHLETPRQWLAGYRAWVDGVPVAPHRAPSGMLGIPLKAGPHAVRLEFTGSARLWAGLVISAAALIGVVLGSLVRPGWKEAGKEGFSRWIETNRT